MKHCKLLLLSVVLILFSMVTVLSVSTASAKDLRAITTIARGYDHTVAIKSNGTLWTWGNNSYGQLGDGTTTVSATPVKVLSSDEIDNIWAAVGAGNYYTIALRANGTLWVWGRNIDGVLANGSTDGSSHPDPAQIGTDTDWVFVSAGYRHVLAIKSDGTLWGWGWNGYNQINGGSTSITTPTQIGTDDDWAYATAGASTSAAIKSNGELYTWGDDGWWQLGNGSITGTVDTPTRIGTDSDWIMVELGQAHAMAIKANGTLYTWGYNGYGKLGIGNTDNKDAPTQVGTDNDWVWASPGKFHTVATKSDGSLYAWGCNSNYQLGDGTTNISYSPVQIGTGIQWRCVSCGAAGTVGTKANGALWHWGNIYSSTNYSTPTRVDYNDWK